MQNTIDGRKAQSHPDSRRRRIEEHAGCGGRLTETNQQKYQNFIQGNRD
jgi:hypothetical protein